MVTMTLPKQLRKGLEFRGIPLSIISDRYDVETINLVSENIKQNYSHYFDEFGFNKDECEFFHSKFTWANVAVKAGLFNSVGNARKSGWFIPIEFGYSEAIFFVGYGEPVFVYILNQF